MAEATLNRRNTKFSKTDDSLACTLIKFQRAQDGFNFLRKEILGRFDPQTGTVSQWQPVHWTADAVKEMFDNFDPWDIVTARRGFYTILCEDELWRKVVMGVADSLADTNGIWGTPRVDRRPGILMDPAASPILYWLVSLSDYMTLYRVCNYTRRMCSQWFWHAFPELHAKRSVDPTFVLNKLERRKNPKWH
jgi:hypothetical protein